MAFMFWSDELDTAYTDACKDRAEVDQDRADITFLLEVGQEAAVFQAVKYKCNKGSMAFYSCAERRFTDTLQRQPQWPSLCIFLNQARFDSSRSGDHG